MGGWDSESATDSDVSESASESGATVGVHRLNLRLAASGSRKYGILSIDSATSGMTSDGRRGILTEIAVPLSELVNAATGDYLCLYAESVTPSGSVAFSLSDPALRSTWQRIRLK